MKGKSPLLQSDPDSQPFFLKKKRPFKPQTQQPRKTPRKQQIFSAESVPGPSDKEPPEDYNAVNVALIKFNAV